MRFSEAAMLLFLSQSAVYECWLRAFFVDSKPILGGVFRALLNKYDEATNQITNGDSILGSFVLCTYDNTNE